MHLSEIVREISGFLKSVRKTLHHRLDKSQIQTVDELVVFVHTRSAYIAQTSLYGYLKTRMGRQYTKIFRDPDFSPSINRSKWAVYSACISDLSVHAVAVTAARSGMDAETARDLCRHCQYEGVVRTFTDDYAITLRSQVIRECFERTDLTLWPNAAIDGSAFSLSPDALADNTPVIDEYRDLDREIVRNSVRFRWSNISEEFSRRMDPDSLASDWESCSSKTRRPADNND